MPRTGALELVRLSALMALSEGSPTVIVALIDGPVVLEHPDLETRGILTVERAHVVGCNTPTSAACRHGTFVAGMLKARRGSPAPAICPGCRLLLRPIFTEEASGDDKPASAQLTARVQDVAAAIIECVDAGARVINLSAATPAPTMRDEPELEAALSHAARRGAIVVAAAGNQASLGGSALTRHAGVIPVVAYDGRGVPMRRSNVGLVVGKRGVGAAGDDVTSLGSDGPPATSQGTSVAAPFVTGTIALLWSLFADATAGEIKYAIRAGAAAWSRSVVPPLLDAYGAYTSLKELTGSPATAVAR
jgi:subtilisin family serine protease